MLTWTSDFDERSPERPAAEGGTPARGEYLVFGAPCLGPEEIDEVVDTLRSGWIGTGPKTQLFEKNFADYIGCRHALAVSSCTAGLHLSLLLSGIGPRDEVITTPMTFAATANAIMHVGARPVFVDIEPDTLNINPRLIEAAITSRTRAILPVHFGGLPCDLDGIDAIARRHGLQIIEDAAHAIGAQHNGRKIGNRGTLTSFSFYANKNLTTGEGGMITTDDDRLAERIEIYRLHGLSTDAWRRYASRELITSEVVAPGYKYNMTDLQASLGIHQLNKVERFLQRREELAELYDAALSECDEIELQPRPPDGGRTRHALHLYLLQLRRGRLTAERDEIVRSLRAENIGAAIHYRALHLHPFYASALPYQPGAFPVAEQVSESVLSLPISPGMTEADAGDVIRAVKKVLREFSASREITVAAVPNAR
jgi:dTDP-4-amino-4,6-dideoxygalactose transaminase